MEWLGIAIAVVVLLFGLVLLFGAPYLPTLGPQIDTAFKLLNLKKGQHLLELGCGDGRVLLAAAKRGYKVTGYELNPLLVIICLIRTWRYRRLVRVVWGNFWAKKLPATDGIFVFLLPKYMDKLDKKIIQEFSKPVKLVSFAFAIESRQATKEQSGLYLYTYK